MKRFSQIFALFVLLAVAGLSRVVFADELTNDDKYFLAGYEKMRTALVADDLVKANEAAAELSAEGFEVPKSETLERARAAFANASEIAIKAAGGSSRLLRGALSDREQRLGANFQNHLQSIRPQGHGQLRRN
jgi:hypothetical protein